MQNSALYTFTRTNRGYMRAKINTTLAPVNFTNSPIKFHDFVIANPGTGTPKRDDKYHVVKIESDICNGVNFDLAGKFQNPEYTLTFPVFLVANQSGEIMQTIREGTLTDDPESAVFDWFMRGTSKFNVDQVGSFEAQQIAKKQAERDIRNLKKYIAVKFPKEVETVTIKAGSGKLKPAEFLAAVKDITTASTNVIEVVWNDAKFYVMASIITPLLKTMKDAYMVNIDLLKDQDHTLTVDRNTTETVKRDFFTLEYIVDGLKSRSKIIVDREVVAGSVTKKLVFA